jgi:hypothetical protein
MLEIARDHHQDDLEGLRMRSARSDRSGRNIACVTDMRKFTSIPIVALAIATTAACGNNNARSNNAPNSTAANPPAADQRAENTAKPITLTGCLQQDGRTYIVTRLNEPSHEGVGTTGNGAAVEREQLREAANAYRVESKDQSDWDKMVGKQVRVSGSVEKNADLPSAAGAAAGSGDRPSAAAGSGTAGNGTAGSTDAGRREKIDKGDLAQIAVASMTVVSDNCGKGTSGSAVKKPAASSKKRR